MENEIPKCNSCGQPMFEIGQSGRTITGRDSDGNVWGRSEKLYQCPECKDVKIA